MNHDTLKKKDSNHKSKSLAGNNDLNKESESFPREKGAIWFFSNHESLKLKTIKFIFSVSEGKKFVKKSVGAGSYRAQRWNLTNTDFLVSN